MKQANKSFGYFLHKAETFLWLFMEIALVLKYSLLRKKHKEEVTKKYTHLVALFWVFIIKQLINTYLYKQKQYNKL